MNRKLEQIFELHQENMKPFEAQLEFICLAVAELKNLAGEIQKSGLNDERKQNLKDIKEIFEMSLTKRLTEEEKVLLQRFLSNQIRLCQSLLES